MALFSVTSERVWSPRSGPTLLGSMVPRTAGQALTRCALFSTLQQVAAPLKPRSAVQIAALPGHLLHRAVHSTTRLRGRGYPHPVDKLCGRDHRFLTASAHARTRPDRTGSPALNRPAGTLNREPAHHPERDSSLGTRSRRFRKVDPQPLKHPHPLAPRTLPAAHTAPEL